MRINYLQWFRSNSFAYFSSLTRSSNISIRKTLEKFRKSYSFSENDFKHEIIWQRICFGRSRSCLYRSNIFFIHSYLKSCVWLLLVAATLHVTSALCERSSSKMKLMKAFLRNSMTSEWLGNIDLLSIERYELKSRFRWFSWWIWQSTW